MRTVGRRKVTVSAKIVVAALMILLIVSVLQVLRYPEDLKGLLGINGMMDATAAIQVASELGYRVSWDDERVYMRPDGLRWNLGRFPEISIRYEDIRRVREEFGPVPALQRRFMPFDHVRIYGRTHARQRFLFVSPNFMPVEDARAVLAKVQEARPELISPVVDAFIHDDRPW